MATSAICFAERREAADVARRYMELCRIANAAIRTQSPGDEKSEGRILNLRQLENPPPGLTL